MIIGTMIHLCAMNSQTKGDIAVAAIIYDLTLKGYTVLRPVVSESCRYDLVVDTGFCFRRVQVKYTENGKISTYTSYTDYSGSHHRPYKLEELDVFAVYHGPTKRIAYLPSYLVIPVSGYAPLQGRQSTAETL